METGLFQDFFWELSKNIIFAWEQGARWGWRVGLDGGWELDGIKGLGGGGYEDGWWPPGGQSEGQMGVVKGWSGARLGPDGGSWGDHGGQMGADGVLWGKSAGQAGARWGGAVGVAMVVRGQMGTDRGSLWTVRGPEWGHNWGGRS